MMHLPKTFSLILLTLICVVTLSQAGEEQVATVVAIRGVVTARSPEGIVRLLKQQDAVLLSDTIQTAERSRAQMLFQDQTLITLGPGGELTIKDYAWKEEDKRGRLDISIKEGAFRVLGGLITKHSPETFKAETRVATIGIRGSSFAGEVQGDHLKVVFLGGKGVYVANAAGTVDIATSMFGTEVMTGAAPYQAALWSREQIESLREVEARPVSHFDVETIINQSDNRGAVNIAVGTGNSANLGTVAVQGSSLNGAVINQADNRDASNVAAGTENQANLGSIDLQEASMEGTIINQSNNREASNLATGTINEANTGSVIIK